MSKPLRGFELTHWAVTRMRVWSFLIIAAVPVLGGRRSSDRGGATAKRRPGFVFPGFLLLEQRGRLQDSWYRLLLSPRRLHEPQSLGRGGLRGDQHPAQQIRRAALCP